MDDERAPTEEGIKFSETDADGECLPLVSRPSPLGGRQYLRMESYRPPAPFGLYLEGCRYGFRRGIRF